MLSEYSRSRKHVANSKRFKLPGIQSARHGSIDDILSVLFSPRRRRSFFSRRPVPCFISRSRQLRLARMPYLCFVTVEMCAPSCEAAKDLSAVGFESWWKRLERERAAASFCCGSSLGGARPAIRPSLHFLIINLPTRHIAVRLYRSKCDLYYSVLRHNGTFQTSAHDHVFLHKARPCRVRREHEARLLLTLCRTHLAHWRRSSWSINAATLLPSTSSQYASSTWPPRVLEFFHNAA